MTDPERIMEALRTVRISNICDEVEIHKKLMQAFDDAAIPYEHEYKVIAHKRFDFWMDGIVIEVKKTKPQKQQLLKQIDRYTAAPQVTALIVVFRNFQGAIKGLPVPKKMNGKPVYSFSLNLNWGIAV